MMSCSTRPVQEPQLALALVCLRTSSSVNRPFSLMALQMACPWSRRCSRRPRRCRPWRRPCCGPGGPPSPMLLSPNISLSRMSLHAAAIAQQLEVPAAVHRVAVQAGADQLVVLEHQLFVHAAKRVAHDDFFRALAAHEVAGGEQVDARDLELGAGQRAGVAANAELGQVVGQPPCPARTAAPPARRQCPGARRIRPRRRCARRWWSAACR
jgi:hypothetical protein